MSTINVEFLRSGIATRNGKRPADAMDTSSTDTAPSPRTSRNARLEAFHRRSLEAMATQQRPSSAPPTGLNVDFLRSGAEFKPSPPPERKAGSDAAPSPRSSRSARLEEFHRKTLQAFKTTDLDAWDGASSHAPVHPPHVSTHAVITTDSSGPAVLNVDFLRSGAEFKPSPPAERKTGSDAAPSPRSSRNARLEQFHRKTLEALTSTGRPRASSAPVAMTTKESMPTLNVDFLRSGAEFKPSPPMERRDDKSGVDDGRPRMSHNARLEEFYTKLLKSAGGDGATPDASKRPPVSPSKRPLGESNSIGGAPPTIVNMDFLRTKAYADTSPMTRRRGDGTGGSGARVSKSQRLETFYQRSLQPHVKGAV